MEEKNSKFWKGFLIGAFCFFVIGALAVLGMTRFLESIAEKRGTIPSGTEALLPGGETREAEKPSSTAIAPVTIPTDKASDPSQETEPAGPTEPAAPTEPAVPTEPTVETTPSKKNGQCFMVALP